MNFKSYQDLSRDITKNLNRLQKEHFDLIVGIPRSGMIPAYIIASLLNINCTDTVSFSRNIPLKHGRTRPLSVGGRNIILPSDANSILLVDDSINSGKSFSHEVAIVRTAAQGKICTLAVYSSSPTRDDVDLIFEYVPFPRAFEWNIFHQNVMGKACVDIDGVLCVNPTEDENDDGPRYLEFLANADPLIVPSHKIFALVTSRLEKYRKETELWLMDKGIVWEQLIMLDLPSKEERVRRGVHAQHKATYYQCSPASIFLESDDDQAREISALSKKVVYCTESSTLYVEGKTSDAVYHSKYCYDGRALRLDQLLFHRFSAKLGKWIRKATTASKPLTIRKD